MKHNMNIERAKNEEEIRWFFLSNIDYNKSVPR